jgi:TPR repeat protein
MINHRRPTEIAASRLALFLIVAIAAASFGPALAASHEGLVTAVAGAFTPAQITDLIALSAGRSGARTDRQAQSLDNLRQMLDVNDDVVQALLRILDRPDIQPAESPQALAQTALQYHAVTDRLTEITSDDPEGRNLVAQARAAVTAGHFNDAEGLLRQLEAREVAVSNRTADGAAEATGPALQHLINAAQVGTVLGEIALMTLRYGEATDYFQEAQKKLALLSHAESDKAPVQSADSQVTAEKALPGLQDRVGSSGRTGAMPPVAQRDSDPAKLDPGPPTATRQPDSAATESGPVAANLPGAVTTAAPRSQREPAGSPSAGAVLSADMIARLLRRGDALLALGDVASARLLYERAAAAGDGRGATGAGKTYDPLFLVTIGARGIRGDPVAAATWYRKAIELGDRSAAEHLTRMSQRTAQ